MLECGIETTITKMCQDVQISSIILVTAQPVKTKTVYEMKYLQLLTLRGHSAEEEQFTCHVK